MYDVSVLLESKNEKQEFELFLTREIAFWSTNCQWSKVIDKKDIMRLSIDDKLIEQGEEKQEIDYVQKYKNEYALRMLNKIAQTHNNN